MDKDLARDLAKIAGLEVDSSRLANIEPLYHSSDLTSRMRSDEAPATCLSNMQALANAQKKDGKFFVAPKAF